MNFAKCLLWMRVTFRRGTGTRRNSLVSTKEPDLGTRKGEEEMVS